MQVGAVLSRCLATKRKKLVAGWRESIPMARAKFVSVRVHQCPFCGLALDRDVNAARNILSLALIKAGREPSEVWRGRVASPLKHETTSM